MDITFLGTGTSQGVPIIGCTCQVCQSTDIRDKRLRSSVLVEVDNTFIVIDTGPDFRQQMLENKVYDITGILLTHEHRDHVAGLDDIRPFNYMHKKAIDLYAEHRVVNELHKSYNYVFAQLPYPGLPQLNLHEITEEPFYINKTEILPIRLLHYKLPILGFRIGDFAYLTDVKTIPDKEKKKLQGLKVLVITSLRKEEHISHMNLQEALDTIAELNPQKAYLTHLSHLFGRHKIEENELPATVRIAYDGLKITI